MKTADVAHAIRFRLAAARWRAAYLAAVAGSFRLEPVAGTSDPGDVPVLVCLWNRPGRLSDVISQLAAQRLPDGRRLRLVLWNNRFDDAEHYRGIAVAAELGDGAVRSIELHSSRTNIGGIARFVALRKLRRAGYRGPYISFDDDQDVTEHFVSDLLAAAAERTIAGWWAWRNYTAYWDREEARPGQEATYVGTGGAVGDSAIADDLGLFLRVPRRFVFMEDVWLSYRARRAGWRLTKVDTPIEFVLSELDQGNALVLNKEELFHHLYPEARTTPLLEREHAPGSDGSTRPS